MPYVGGSLAVFCDPSPTERAAKRMTDNGGDKLHDLVVQNTPVDTRNLRTSWYRMARRARPTPFGMAYESVVATEVDYAPYVEHGTGLWGPEHKKYLIVPKKPGGTLRWTNSVGQTVFAARVMHPGSPGAYMMASSLAKMEVLYEVVQTPILRRWKVEQEAKAVEAMAGVVIPG